MRTILIIIIAALIAVGAMAVDEYHVRQDLKSLQEENQRLGQELIASNQKLAEAKTVISKYEASAAAWDQERERMQAEINTLKEQCPQAGTWNPAPSPARPAPSATSILGWGAGSVIACSSILAGALRKGRNQPRRPVSQPEEESRSG